tara:strand:- start:110 stop:730 length:621 start_codon:yes stop_codon:yes gene_type:complete
MKESPEKKEASKNYQSSFLRDIFNKPNDALEFKIKKWNPKYCGDIDMRIASDGTWFYCGSPINRKKLVKLFSSILINENNKYFLITPVEKVGIIVDDAPFIANDFEKIIEKNKSYLVFFTNIDETIVLSKKNPFRISINDKTQEPSPYIMVRKNIEAKIDRKSFYRLLDLAEYSLVKGQEWLGIYSDSTFFPIISKKKLDNELLKI